VKTRLVRLLALKALLCAPSLAAANVITLDPGQSLEMNGDTIYCRESGSPDPSCRPEVLCGECRYTNAGGKRSCTVIPCEGQIQQFEEACTPEPADFRCDDCVKVRGQTWGYVVFRNGAYYETVAIGDMNQCLQRRLADWRCYPGNH
jgi:hypothetical protein